MADDSLCSADTDDLDHFVEGSDLNVGALAETNETLRSGRHGLAALPLPYFVEQAELTAYADLADLIRENGNFVREISSALKTSGTNTFGSRYEAPTSLIQEELDKSNDERLDELQATLENQGIDPAEAAKIRAEIEQQLEDDPAISFHDAILAGMAEYEGIDVEELERRQRAFTLYPAEVGTVINENFDVIASQTGDDDIITIEDLHLVIEDESLPPQVRDAAFRLAADGILFNNMDVAKQTNLTDEPLGNGFRWNKTDGDISRADAEQFNEKNYHAEILAAWHPFIETANQGYDLSKVDSHAGEADVLAFVTDPDIPLHVRKAVADIYANKYMSVIGPQYELEQQQQEAADYGFVGPVPLTPTAPTQTPVRPTTPGPARPTTPVRAPGGGGGGGGGYAVLLILGATLGWDYGTRRRIERDGNPSITCTDPQTGREHSVDPSELEHLTPEQAKAWVAYFATYGGPPTEPIDTIEPFAYLDAEGQWRMSDTGEPVHVEPYQAPPDGQFYDSEGNLRYRNGELVDAEAEPEPQLATDGAGNRAGSGGRRINPPPGESDIWRDFQNVGNGRKTNGLSGRNKQYYEWDYTHNDIEVYNHRGQHIGSMDPVTGEIYKPAVFKRDIQL